MTDLSGPETAPARSLTRQALRAGITLSLMVSAGHLLMLVRTLVLARLLAPREFGLMGIAFIAITAAEVFSQTGFNRAIVQRRDDAGPYLHTIWVISVARGFLLTTILYLIAPLLEVFFRTPEATPVLRAVALRFILTGIVSPAWYLLEREMRMARYALPSLVGGFVDLVVTCILAFQLRNVWAMVYGYLAGATVLTFMTFIVAPYLPRLHLSLERARALYAFGKHVFRYELITYLVQQSDRIAVGRLLDATSLGLYTFAWRLSVLPAQMLQIVIVRVAFPAFARVQQEPARVREGYARLIGLISMVSFPVALGLLATAPELVPVVFGAKWIPMTTTFRILCLMGITTAVEQTSGTIGASIGRPQMATRASLLRVLMIVIAIVPATIHAGIEGTAVVALAAGTASALYLFLRVNRVLGAGARELLPALGIPALASAGMVGCVSALRAWTPVAPPALNLAMLIIGGAATYLAFGFVVDRLQGGPMKTSLVAILRSR